MKVLPMLIFSLILTNSLYAQKLVEVTKINPTIKKDIRYAAKNNFTKKVIYTTQGCYLLEHVAQVLDNVQKELAQKGLGLLVWDAYRPLSAQKKLWDAFPDPRYVAPPGKGGRHTRGTTVDVTLIALKDGKQLLMPTDHDDFTAKAASNYKEPDVSEQAKKNRELLKTVMIKHGFKTINGEWWHFDYHDWQEHKPLDIDFEELTNDK